MGGRKRQTVTTAALGKPWSRYHEGGGNLAGLGKEAGAYVSCPLP